MITILVVDNSPVSRDLLCKILGDVPEFKIVGTAGNGQEAKTSAGIHRPQVIVMDTELPVLDGYEATRSIMESYPVPVILLSSPGGLSKADADKAIAAGAVATIVKPVAPSHPGYKNQCRHLIRTIRVMSEVKLVKRWAVTESASSRPPNGDAAKNYASSKADETQQNSVANTTDAKSLEINGNRALLNKDLKQSSHRHIRFVVIGASTGGPPALRTILSQIPRDFPASILIVQHIAPGFLDSMCSWLLDTTGVDIRIASDGEMPLAGHVYLAPDGFHMHIDRQGRIALTTGEPENGLRPSVSCLFRSIADLFARESVGVLLTGMGKDGADELQRMRSRGSITIAQDEETSVVHGMPGEAIRLEAASHILPADEIAAMIVELVKPRNAVEKVIREEHHGS